MKLAFPSESTIVLDIGANKDLPDAEKVKATIKWPTVKENGDIPKLVYEDVPAPTGENPLATRSRATHKSLQYFADAVLRRQVTKIENLEGIATGEDLANQPEDAAAEIVWAIVVAFRAGPGAVIEKKKD
jgi:hypothetical protein